MYIYYSYNISANSVLRYKGQIEKIEIKHQQCRETNFTDLENVIVWP